MLEKLRRNYLALEEKGLTAEQARKIRAEIDIAAQLLANETAGSMGLYSCSDYQAWGLEPFSRVTALAPTRSIDELMARDKQREVDGFPRKIRLGKMVKPGGKNDDRVVVVPTTVEEKFIHDLVRIEDEGEGEGEGDDQGFGGQGEGEEGEVIGEQPVREAGEGEGGAGKGSGGVHEIESNAYDLVLRLTLKEQQLSDYLDSII